MTVSLCALFRIWATFIITEVPLLITFLKHSHQSQFSVKLVVFFFFNFDVIGL